MYARNHITPDSALGGWQMKRSLRWEGTTGGSGSYLYRTGSSPTGGGKYSYSSWIKRVDISGQTCLWGAGGGSQTNTHAEGIYITGSNQIALIYRGAVGSGSVGWYAYSKNLIRDYGSWYHIMLTYDNNQSGIANKIKYYFNGVEVPYYSGVGSPGDLEFVNKSGVAQYIGRMDQGAGPGYARVYQAETHVADGYIWTPSDFGYTDAQTGQWRPKRPQDISVNYGNNGFYLDYADNTSTSTIGIDRSGNSNNWTASGFNVGSGIDNDSVEDTPTNNWCVWNLLTDVSDITLSEGNLKAVSGTDSWPAIFGTHGASSGKWYYEAVGADNTRWGLGWSTEDFKYGTSNTFSEGHFAYSQDPLTFYQGGSNSAINGTPAFTTGNVLQIAIDIDAGKTWFGINNTWVNASNGSAGDPAAGTNPTVTFSEKGQKHYPKMINNLGNVSVNFGQQGFAYTPPAGFQALNSKNLATVNAAGVVNPKRHFAVINYSGNSSTNKITGLEFKPDCVWTKVTNATGQYSIFDSVRGVTKRLGNGANGFGTNVETTVAASLQSFDENGFTFGAEAGNNNGENYTAWCWKGGGTAVSNSDGTITSSVSVNKDAGFSVVGYTGNETDNATVGHGLGKSPDVVIIKDRVSNSAGNNWYVYHSALTSGHYVKLNQTSNSAAVSGTSNGGVGSVTSTTFNFIQGTSGNNKNVNESGDTFIAYCWTAIPGYSKFGSYVGNGDNGGTFVNFGFKPAFVILKRLASESWIFADIKRTTNELQPIDYYLLSTSNAAQSTGIVYDFVSNGIKFRSNSQNELGSTYIYMAWAEEPSGTGFGLDANCR